MEEWQERLLEEATDLNVKIIKLDDFINYPPKGVTSEDINYLMIQKSVMLTYLRILKMRIESLNL